MGERKDLADDLGPQWGRPRKGNMKPESRIEGRKTKKVICIACSWFFAIIEKVMPMARLAANFIGNGLVASSAAGATGL
ncbi:hypothetical protein BH20VER3_BH20VER3_20540 [soil metagenome]